MSAIGFFKKLVGPKPKLIKLLTATIWTDEDHKYFVSLERNHPQLRTPEFVRLILYYYAKVLVIFPPSVSSMAESGLMLKKMMASVVSGGIQKDSNIFRLAEIDDVAEMVSAPPQHAPRKIVAKLFFVNPLQRSITTDLPLKNMYAQHGVFSVMALLQAVLREVDQDCIGVLNRSLANMNEAYEAGQSYSDMCNFLTVPTAAYLSAIKDV